MLIRKLTWVLLGVFLVLTLGACNQSESTPPSQTPSAATTRQPGAASNLPTLVDVGADKCVPCIKMAPILDQLRKDFAGRMEVKFVDVWKYREEADKYSVRTIPTQIFYAPGGSELYRHIGFYGREEILGKWRELGYSFEDKMQ